MARLGDTCGAVMGGMMALGLKFPRLVADDAEAKEKNYRLVHEFVEEFNRRFEKNTPAGICLDLSRGHLKPLSGLQTSRNLGKRCSGFVREAAEILEEIIERQE